MRDLSHVFIFRSHQSYRINANIKTWYPQKPNILTFTLISQSQKCDPTDTDRMWKMNFNYHTFWMMWHQGQDVKIHFLKNPPHAFHHKDLMLFFICMEEDGVTDVNATWLSLFNCGGEINAAQLLFNMFFYNWQTIKV